MAPHAPHQRTHVHPCVTRHRAGEDADVVLRRSIARQRGVPVTQVRTGRLCPRCGSSSHGRPWARIESDEPGTSPIEIPVSISRSGDHLITAVRSDGPVGVDIESIAAVERHWDPALVLHPSERGTDRTPEQRARLWAGKEAVLKALGVGLARPMPTIVLAAYDVQDVAAPEGYVIACARL